MCEILFLTNNLLYLISAIVFLTRKLSVTLIINKDEKSLSFMEEGLTKLLTQ